jgi:hypothetical protein
LRRGTRVAIIAAKDTAMRQLRRVLLAALLVVGPATTPAHAVTVADLINLRANGVSDDILVGLIQTDGTRIRHAGFQAR